MKKHQFSQFEDQQQFRHVIARYAKQRIPQHQGNPLIEALPPSMTDDELTDCLTLRPEFNTEQRDWPAFERLNMLPSLLNFMVPLERHIELARALDGLIRAGYVGRAPMSAGQIQIYQAIYDKQMAGVSFRQSAQTRTPQLSTSLIGISGMGKTTTVTRWLAHIPQVIYHEELNLYQVPYLHIEMPSNGASVKGLAYAILHTLDALIPNAHYFETYAGNGRTGHDGLMGAVARVMNHHLVGLLICDEVQNLTNASKGGQIVMTELVSACNTLKVPILLIGTNKARDILSLDFRQGRRATGQGIAPWSQLPPPVASAEKENIDEWVHFLEVLWSFQWVKNPVPFGHEFSNLMYDLSQGVIDVAIKLFGAVQAKAISDGSETITLELICEVYDKQFYLLHPMLLALRNNDIQALMAFDDISPLTLQQIVDDAARRVLAKTSRTPAKKTQDNSDLANRVASALIASGIDEEVALSAATKVAEDKSLSAEQALTIALKSIAPPKRSSRSKNPKQSEEVISFDDRPEDYRRAIVEAKKSGKKILEVMKALGQAQPLDELLVL